VVDAQIGNLSAAELTASLAVAVSARLGGDPGREAGAAKALCIATVRRAPASARGPCLAARAKLLAAYGPDAVQLFELDTQLGILAYTEGRYGDALAAFRENEQRYRRIYGEHPAIDTMLDNQGWTLVELGRAAEAVPILEGVVARRPTWGDPANALAMAHRSLGDLEAAAAAHQLAIDHGDARSVRVEGLIGLGEVRWRQGRLADALGAFDRAEALAQGQIAGLEEARLRFGRARILVARGQRERAATEARAALERLDAGAVASPQGPAARLRAEIIDSKIM
jgi:tetratricopeptide (TPR) repeat protein